MLPVIFRPAKSQTPLKHSVHVSQHKNITICIHTLPYNVLYPSRRPLIPFLNNISRNHSSPTHTVTHKPTHTHTRKPQHCLVLHTFCDFKKNYENNVILEKIACYICIRKKIHVLKPYLLITNPQLYFCV